MQTHTHEHTHTLMHTYTLYTDEYACMHTHTNTTYNNDMIQTNFWLEYDGHVAG